MDLVQRAIRESAIEVGFTGQTLKAWNMWTWYRGLSVNQPQRQTYKAWNMWTWYRGLSVNKP